MNELNIVGHRVECKACGEKRALVSSVKSVFEYNNGAEIVELSAEVPVVTCSSCGLEYTTAEAEAIKHEAVCSYLGILNPKQIQAIRREYRMTRSVFSEMTGFGSASLARWEAGDNVQNKANDNFLRLLQEKSNMEYIAGLKPSAPVEKEFPVYQCLHITPSLRSKSESFRLR